MEEPNPELESFRQQWRAEVSARSKPEDSKTQSKGPVTQPSTPLRKQPGLSRLVKVKALQKRQEGGEDGGDILAGQGPGRHARRLSAEKEDIEGFRKKDGSREPRSALEHYEKVVERESQGSLGDSLNLYRKAFKVGKISCELFSAHE
jgi:F-box protein 9